MAVKKQRPKRQVDEIDIGLACDGDLNTVWQAASKAPSPRQRITVGKVSVFCTRQLFRDGLRLPRR